MSALIIGEMLVSGMIQLALQKSRVDALIETARLENREPTREELLEIEDERRQVMEDLNASIDAAITRG